MFAEMLSDMYTETLNSVNDNSFGMCVFTFIDYIALDRHTTNHPVSQSVFLNLYDHDSFIRWIVGTLSPTDSLMKKISLVLYYYLKPSFESKECRRPFRSQCVSAPFPIFIRTDNVSTHCLRYRTNFSLCSSPSTDLQIRKFLSQL